MRENAGVCDRETAYESEGWHEIKRERESLKNRYSEAAKNILAKYKNTQYQF